jgi:hypothetical protein
MNVYFYIYGALILQSGNELTGSLIYLILFSVIEKKFEEELNISIVFIENVQYYEFFVPTFNLRLQDLFRDQEVFPTPAIPVLPKSEEDY